MNITRSAAWTTPSRFGTTSKYLTRVIDATMITKMELVEGELGRFAMIRGEEPT